MTEYEYGGREAERQHAMRELQQLQMGLASGVLSHREYEKGVARVRRRHGLLGWGYSDE